MTRVVRKLTNEAREATIAIGHSHAQAQYRQGASKEAALAAGQAWTEGLAAEMLAGSLTHLNDQPCTIDWPEWAPAAKRTFKQMKMGTT